MAKKIKQKRSLASNVKKAGASKAVFILAHGAGHALKGCKHKDIQAWAKALRAHGDVIDTLKYGKPYNLMGNLCTTHVGIIEKAIRSKATQVFLIGFGMGARVAVHMMGKTPGDDGKPLPAIPETVIKAVKGMVAINYPLLRVGSREVRSKPLLTLSKKSPKMLFVTAPKDAHMDSSKLKAITQKMKPKTQTLELVGGESEKPTDMKAVVQQIAQFAR